MTNGNSNNNQALAVANNDLSLSSLSQAFVKSGYFTDVRDEAKAIVKILYGTEVGIGPVAAMMNIHVIEGKPAISSNLMAAMIKRSGRYNYRVLYNEADGCELEFTDNGEIVGKSSFRKADAVAAGCLNKQNWQKYPKAMYFARALSQGARMFCADIFLGAIYETESGELEDTAHAPAVPNYAEYQSKPVPVANDTPQVSRVTTVQQSATIDTAEAAHLDAEFKKLWTNLTDQGWKPSEINLEIRAVVPNFTKFSALTPGAKTSVIAVLKDAANPAPVPAKQQQADVVEGEVVGEADDAGDDLDLFMGDTDDLNRRIAATAAASKGGK